MARARKGTPEGDLATKYWRETMQERYGNPSEFMRTIAAKGGRNSNNGGFASKKVGSDGLTGAERAVRVGTIGGRISKRGKKVVSN